MSKTIKLNESQVGTLKAFATSRKSQIDIEIKELKQDYESKYNTLIKEAEGLEGLLGGLHESRVKRAYKKRSTLPEVSELGKMTWAQRASHVLNQTPKMLTSTEIIAGFIALEPKYAEHKRTVESCITAQLSTLSRKVNDRFIKYFNDRGVYVYGNNPRFKG